MYTGVVIWLSKVKKRGFIIQGLRDNISFHISEIQKDDFLKKGDRVEFDTVLDSRGLKAVNIRKIS